MVLKLNWDIFFSLLVSVDVSFIAGVKTNPFICTEGHREQTLRADIQLRKSGVVAICVFH